MNIKKAKEYTFNMRTRSAQWWQAFPKEFRGYGCFVRAEMAIGETSMCKSLRCDQVLDIYKKAMNAGAVLTDWDKRKFCIVIKPGWVADQAARALGMPGNEEIIHVNTEYKIRYVDDCQYAILDLRTARGGLHKVEANNKGEMLYNPHYKLNEFIELNQYILYRRRKKP